MSVLTLLGSSVLATPEPELEGYWSGVWVRDGSELAVTLRFERTDAGWEGSFDSEQLRVIGVPFGDISVAYPEVSWRLVGDRTTLTFQGRLEGDILSGAFDENGAPGMFRLERYTPSTSPPAEKELTFSSGDVTLSGTLLLPSGVTHPVPAVIFLHGSGPEGRWASKYLAVRFAEAGIAALIFDKRGVGSSTGDWSTIGFEELDDDAVAGIRALQREPSVDASRIGLHGHSQGGTLAPLVAQKVPELAFVVASAAAGLPMDSVEVYSLEHSVGFGSLSAEDRPMAREFIHALVASAYRGEPRDRLLASWEQVREKPWVFAIPDEDSHYWAFSRRIADYDPELQWAHVTAPVLLVYGELDQRVPPRASASRIATAVLEGTGNSVSVRIFQGADHSFRLGTTGNASVWPRSAPGYPGALINWVQDVTGVPRAGMDHPKGDESPAVAIEREVLRLAAMNGENDLLWPGFDPLAIPLAVYDGERTFLFRHPAPPEGFLPVPGAAPATYVWQGRHEAVTANTNAEVGGVATATILLDQPQPGGALLDLAAVAIHEAFHVYQRAHHPGWIGNEADLFTYPTDSADLLALRRLETDALRQALTTDEPVRASCWARQALALRRERFAPMDSAFVAYERGTELNEGLATYVEMRAAGRRAVNLPPAEFGPAEVRHRAYATGSAFALLLDRIMPGWPALFEANDGQTLDAALGEALGAGETCTFGDAAVAAAEQKARTDVAALTVERARRLVAFEGKPGWRVVVEAGGGEPLWPQGFDPLNVERVEAARVLHTRFLRLGNGAGWLEVLNAEALTDGTGSHPLFQGVQRVVLTGLAEPEVGEAEGAVTVRAPGLTMEFKGASVMRSGEVITVRVGS